MRNGILWAGALLLFALVLTACIGEDQSIQYGDLQEESEGDGDGQPDGDNQPDGDADDEAALCVALDPYAYGQCAMILGVVFDGEDCVWASGCGCDQDCENFFDDIESCLLACNLADGDTDVDAPACDCEHFSGIYCPGPENSCEGVKDVRVAESAEIDCLFEIAFLMVDDSVESMTMEGCNSFQRNLEDADCSIIYSSADNSFKIGCNWCDFTTFSKENCADYNECETWADCPGCSLCMQMGERNMCVGIGDYECMENVECNNGQFCEAFRPDRPECGGVCVDIGDRFYDIHEWGVNVLLPGGGSQVRSTPYSYEMIPQPEKPVIYIYGDHPFQLDVAVHFPEGGFPTEVWPLTPIVGPEEIWPPIPLHEVVWNGIQVSQGECDLTPTPRPGWDEEVWPDEYPPEIYELPNWIIDDADCLTHDDIASRLLFYTGKMPDYQTPIEASFSFGGAFPLAVFHITNNGARPVFDLFFIYRDTTTPCDDGTVSLLPPYCPVTSADLAWGYLPVLEPGVTTTVDAEIVQLDSGDDWTPVIPPEDWEAQGNRLRECIIAAGLTGDEADRFMASWTDIFFGVIDPDMQPYLPEYSEGAFMLYRWASETYDEVLPLLLDPLPRERVRMMVEYRRLYPPELGYVEGATWIDYYDEFNVDSAPEPAPGATVEAYGINDEGPPLATTVSDDDAHYSLQLPPGTYDLVASLDIVGTEPGWVYGVVVEAGEVTIADITMMMSYDIVLKPNIYLYPTETCDVDVSLLLAEGCRVTESIPPYGDGWHVSVAPDGVIDGQYGYLYYESQIPHDYSKDEGWVLPYADLEGFFNGIFDAYGFNEKEKSDFIAYWMNYLPQAPYYAIYPLDEPAEIDPLVGLAVTPAPDTLFRLWLVIESLSSPISLPEPGVSPFERVGFTAVEWGVILN